MDGDLKTVIFFYAKGVVLLLHACAFTGVALPAATPRMKSYAIELPQYVLRFELPAEVARDILPYKPIISKFESLDPAFFRNDFKELAMVLHEFKSPFRGGVYGGLSFHIFVQRRSHEYDGEIQTPNGLQKYILWWLRRENSPTAVNFEHRQLNGQMLVRRWNAAFVGPLNAPEDLEIFSFPISADAFVDIGFNITEWKEGSTKKWKPHAEELRKMIIASIKLEVKK